MSDLIYESEPEIDPTLDAPCVIIGRLRGRFRLVWREDYTKYLEEDEQAAISSVSARTTGR